MAWAGQSRRRLGIGDGPPRGLRSRSWPADRRDFPDDESLRKPANDASTPPTLECEEPPNDAPSTFGPCPGPDRRTPAMRRGLSARFGGRKPRYSTVSTYYELDPIGA